MPFVLVWSIGSILGVHQARRSLLFVHMQFFLLSYAVFLCLEKKKTFFKTVTCILEIINFRENLRLKFEAVLAWFVILLLLIYLWMQKENLNIYRKLYEYLNKCPSSGVKRLGAFIAGQKIAVLELRVKWEL